MSSKRQATTELNHDNWDAEDSMEPEEMGTFKTASKDVLEKRVIRTAIRRSQVSSDEPKKSVFSGFGGFNKTPQSSFDFLANLTNGSKANNNQPTTKTDTAVSSSIFTNKSLTSAPSGGIFSMSGSSAFATKSTLGKSPEGTLFGSSTGNSNASIQSVFTASKADSTVNDSPFKLQSSPKTSITDVVPKPNAKSDMSTSQVSSTIFGVPSNSNGNKSLFAATASNSTLFTSQSVSSTTTTPTTATSSATTCKVESNNTQSNSNSDVTEEKRQRYYSKLRGLNESVSEWIRKHVTLTPLCILSPIFRDYEKYLTEIQFEYKGGHFSAVKEAENKVETKASPETKTLPASNNVSSSIFGNTGSSNGAQAEAPKNNIDTTFGSGSNTTTTTAKTGFSFGIKPSSTTNASSIFPLSTTTTNAGGQFSFGINKGGFSFNTSNLVKTQAAPEPKEEDEEPPKVEYTPVVEDNSVFDTKCKIFIKKDGNFVDKGVGTLYIKKIEESGKHQLLVRANTSLGTILLNLILTSSIPTQRMGKNNVMLVCIPTPDAKPPPAPILIRVKTTEEADNLLSTLNKFKA